VWHEVFIVGERGDFVDGSTIGEKGNLLFEGIFTETARSEGGGVKS
jgi:hypothetical protein